MSSSRPVIPIYTTRGDLGAYLVYPYIYNPQGDWIGWVTPDRKIFSVLGYYVGWLTSDPRILRKRAGDFEEPRRAVPAAPQRFVPPDHVPLPSLMSELTYGIIDVLEDEPELLPSPDFGELREDMD